MAVEMAIRLPAYEPGPRPTINLSGAPNFLEMNSRFSKNDAEFLRSFGHSRTKSTPPSSQATPPRAVEISSDKIFIQ
jgi:hypothetical protein